MWDAAKSWTANTSLLIFCTNAQVTIQTECRFCRTLDKPWKVLRMKHRL